MENPFLDADYQDFKYIERTEKIILDFYSFLKPPPLVAGSPNQENSLLNFDDLVKSHETDDTVKSSRCKAHKSLGTRRT